MARPKTQINRKNDIINAAQKLFAEKGLEKTTIEEIAKETGISKGSVYLDFKNKNDILLSIIESHANSLIVQLELLIENIEPPYLEILKQVLRKDVLNIFDMIASQFQTHIGLLHTSHQIEQQLAHIKQRWLKIISLLLKKAFTNGEIQPYNDYMALAHLISVTLQGFLPPYDLKYSIDNRIDITREEIRAILLNDASIALEIILCGLKTAKYNENLNLIKES